MKISAKKQHIVRDILWNDNKFCCWCGVETVLLKGFIPTKGQPAPHNMATVEHIYSRHSELPRLPNNEKMISCCRCNARKGKLEDKLVFKVKRKLSLDECEKINNIMRNQ